MNHFDASWKSTNFAFQNQLIDHTLWQQNQVFLKELETFRL